METFYFKAITKAFLLKLFLIYCLSQCQNNFIHLSNSLNFLLPAPAYQ